MLPSVIGIGSTPTDLAHRDARFVALANDFTTDLPTAANGPERLIVRGDNSFRLHILDGSGAQTPCAVLPLDGLFEVRVAAARRLWLVLNGREPNDDPAGLSKAQRDHLVTVLRALDGHLANATYREIAAALFGVARLPERGWKTHDLRDRTIRLVRLGTNLMQSGYRRLLLRPFRQHL